MEYFEYKDCGCRIPIINGVPKIDFNNLNLNCPKIWKLYQDGYTTNVFQLGSYLGKRYVKELEPKNLDDAAALISIIRPGCISGDTNICTQIYKKSNGHLCRKFASIKEIYENPDKYKTLISCDESNLTYFNNNVKNVIYSGKKEVFKLKLNKYLWDHKFKESASKKAYTLKCTNDHKLLTSNGWKELKDIKYGERILVWGYRTNKNFKKTTKCRHGSGEVKNAKNMQWFKQICFYNYEYKCVLCDWDQSSLDCNHINGNRHKDNSSDNLCFLCPNHHRMFDEGSINKEKLIEAKEKYRLQQGDDHFIWAQYQGKESLGIEDTYDISMEGPNHNFIAGNVVVHNCLQATDENGTSLTQIYCDRKTERKEVPLENPIYRVKPDTLGIIIYQEEIILIAEQIAGFSKVKALKFMKTCAKKKAEELFAFEEDFLEGCKTVGKVTENEAKEIFENLKASSRYSFNKCVIGSEKIKFSSSRKNQFHPTIEEMYKIKNDREYAVRTNHYQLWKKYNNPNQGYPKSFSICEDGRLRSNQIKDITFEGKAHCYKIITESGNECSISFNHKFPTDRGKIEAQHLKVGDELYICGKYEKCTNKYTFSDQKQGTNGGTINKAFGSNNYGYTNGEYTKFKNYKQNKPDYCEICNKINCRLEIHHKDKNRQNNEFSNLQTLCVSCHKKEDYKIGRNKKGEKGYPILKEKIIKIINIGEKNVYNIEMYGPNHTYTFESNIVTCNSHAVSYAVLGAQVGWLKAHLPYHYLCAWLRHAKSAAKPQDEIRATAAEARRLQIQFCPPSLKTLPNTDFFIKDKSIYFGLDSIKGCGEKGFAKLIPKINSVDWDSTSWTDFLFLYSNLLNKTQIINLIQTGAFDFFGLSRMKMEYEYNQWKSLTSTETKQIINNHKENNYLDLQSAIIDVEAKNAKQKNKIQSIINALKSPPISLDDSRANIITNEKELLGVNISYKNIQKCSLPNDLDKIKEVSEGLKNEYIVVGEISEYKEFKIKKGKLSGEYMAAFKIIDDTDECDCVCFPKQLKEFESAFFDSNVCLFECTPSNRGSGLIVNQVYEV